MSRADSVEKIKKAARKVKKHARAAGFKSVTVHFCELDEEKEEDDYTVRVTLQDDSDHITMWL